MKQTEIGLIPDDWEVKTLGDVATIIGGGTPSTLNSAYWNGDIQWFTPAELSDSKKYISKSERTITERGLKESSAKLLPKGTVLLTTRASIGLTAILKNPACTNQGFQSLIANDICCNEFLYYVIPLIKDEMLSRASGSTFAEISAKKLSTITLQLPPLPEQQRIAKSLSDVDSLIFTTEKLLQKKKNIKQGTMQNLLTGKKRLLGFSKSTNYKQSELGLIPEDWEVMSLGEISTIIMGQSPNSDCYNTQKGMVLIQGNADISNRKTICRFYTTHITKTARKGDVIFTVRAPVGNVAKATFDCCLGRGVCAIQSISDFLYYYLIFIEDSWSKTSTGSTFDSINSDTLASTLIIQPSSKEEQTAIANVLSSMDKEIETLNTKLEKYRNLKTAMMQQLLTGKIRLK